jgi:asparagine synthetase B (glutamine-hydrolysing)
MRNNHPLHHGDIVGVHNGVIRNYSDILKVTGRQDPLTEVDSESIFAAVNKWGGKAGLARVSGDMVAVYVNLLELDTIYLAKSHGRPLVMATTPAGSLVWASEEQALDALGMDLTNYSELGTNRLLTVKQGKVVSRIQYRTATRTRPSVQPPATTKTKPKTKHETVVAKSDPMMDEVRAIAAKRGITNGTPIDGLYYFNGLLLTKREFMQAIEDELAGVPTTEGA